MQKIIKIFIALSIAGFLFGFFMLKGTSSSSQKVVNVAFDFIKKNLVAPGIEAKLNSFSKEKGIYKLNLDIAGRNINVFLTEDGRYLFLSEPIDIKKGLPTPPPAPQAKAPEKREKPDVKLFVMSYCPFGLQMEKAFLPVWQILKDKADMGIYFVDYIMHEKRELDENLRQYCIQKEDKEKFLSYLDCFTKNGDSQKCILEAKIDEGKLNSCISQTDEQYKISKLYQDKSTWLNGRFPKFEIHTDLNKKYGVQGSPTLIINDQEVSVERSPEKIKQVICNSFLNPPPECETLLSNDVPSPGFGVGSAQNSGGGQCQ
jgi:hypothetical protein